MEQFTPTWEEPPVDGRRGHKDPLLTDAVEAVIANPGRWLRWPRTYAGHGNARSAIHSAVHTRNYSVDDFEIRERSSDEGSVGWVRYVPEERP